MDMVSRFLKMRISMKASGLMIRSRALAKRLITLEIFILVNLRMVLSTFKERRCSQLIMKSIKDNMLTERLRVKACTNSESKIKFTREKCGSTFLMDLVR